MIKEKSVVIYKTQIAIVTEVSDKYSINFVGGSQKVREKDIILLHKGPAASVNQITEPLKNSVLIKEITEQLLEVYELLLETEDINKDFSIEEIASLCRDSYKVEECGIIYTQLSTLPNFKISKTSAEDGSPCFNLCPKDEVEKIQKQQNEKSNEVALRNEFLQRLKNKKIILPDDAKYMQEIEALALGKTEKSKNMKDAGFTETQEKAHKLLLNTGFWKITRNPYPYRFGLSIQSATEKLESPPKENREKIESVAYAIDNKWSTDPDDAIAFDGEYLYVHIADPASTVYPDSKIDIAARNRGSTLYIPEGAARMLSEECLSDYALGLSPLSNALSFKIKLDENGAIIDSQVLKTLVKVERLTYEEAYEQRDQPYLAPLYKIAEKNIERRKKANAVFMDFPEVHITIKEDETVEITPVTHLESSVVVREMMVLAGEAAARFAFKNQIAFPYVSQESPDFPKDIPEGLAGLYRMRKSMRSRTVSITPGQHAGLGLGIYSQVTSPLRRYGDLVAHQQLRAFLDGKELLDKTQMLNRIAQGDAAASATVKAERKSNLHWTLVYLMQNPDWTGEAICVDKKGKQAVFMIPSIAQETIITPGREIELNEKVNVKASKIELAELLVNFQII